MHNWLETFQYSILICIFICILCLKINHWHLTLSHFLLLQGENNTCTDWRDAAEEILSVHPSSKKVCEKIDKIDLTIYFFVTSFSVFCCFKCAEVRAVRAASHVAYQSCLSDYSLLFAPLSRSKEISHCCARHCICIVVPRSMPFDNESLQKWLSNNAEAVKWTDIDDSNRETHLLLYGLVLNKLILVWR